MAQAHGGNPTAMLTLTVNPAEGSSPSDRAVMLSHAWRRLRRAAMKHYSYVELPFIAVFEKHRSGEPHLHILIRKKWLGQKWVSAWMKTEINSPIVDIRTIKKAGMAAAYVAKYVGKDPHRFEGTKRYWRSTDYEQRPDETNEYAKPTPDNMEVVREIFDKWINQMQCRGFIVTHHDHKAIAMRPEQMRKRE